jgi:hypothetical protein
MRLACAPLLIVLIFLLFTRVTAQPAEPIYEAWCRPLGGVQCLAISPDGARIAVVSWGGEVYCWEGGRQRWRRDLPGAEAVVLGAGGRAVVYTPLDALHRDLLVLDPHGNIRGRSTAGGPITTLALSPNGQNLAVGTAGGAIEIHSLDDPSTPVRIALAGICRQLGFDSQNNLVVASIDPACLAVYKPSGKRLWRVAAPAGGEFRLGTPPAAPAPGAGATITVAAIVAADLKLSIGSALSPHGRETGRPVKPMRVSPAAARQVGRVRSVPDNIQLVAFSAAGKPIWRHILQGRNPCLRLIPGTGETVVAYERAGRPGVGRRYHHVLACFDRDGVARREQGGMVYNPLLVCASPDGSALLSLSSGNQFWLLSVHGRTLWSYTVRAPVRMVRASTDGTAVAVTTSDGQLCLLKINPAVGGLPHKPAEVTPLSGGGG